MAARTIDDKIEAEQQLTSALQGLKVQVEAYPDLKANQNFLQLQEELSDIENKLAAARRFFNGATTEYNNAVESFPGNLIARNFGFQREICLTWDEDTRKQMEEPLRFNFRFNRRSRLLYRSLLRNHMQYIGLASQISKNNLNSSFIADRISRLCCWQCFMLFSFLQANRIPKQPNQYFLQVIPFVLVGVGIWFLIAWAGHAAFIRLATGAKPLERKENKRVYNLLENICISQGMKMPKLNIIEDDSLNAFASGINEKSYSVTLSRGIIE